MIGRVWRAAMTALAAGALLGIGLCVIAFVAIVVMEPVTTGHPSGPLPHPACQNTREASR